MKASKDGYMGMFKCVWGNLGDSSKLQLKMESRGSQDDQKSDKTVLDLGLGLRDWTGINFFLG